MGYNSADLLDVPDSGHEQQGTAGMDDRCHTPEFTFAGNELAHPRLHIGGVVGGHAPIQTRDRSRFLQKPDEAVRSITRQIAN